MRTLALLTSLAALAVLAAPAGASSAASVQARGSSYGTVLFDGRGFVLYAFTKDAKGRSACSGACAKAWPPYIVSARPRAAAGAKRTLLGTTRRSDGRLQATYAGHPLYYYVGDRKPGQILCQNVAEFGGTWLVLRPDGSLRHGS
jgi:predicted lipoprotein with Yx(FWY)xxD motif